jgi:hypothetical protein
MRQPPHLVSPRFSLSTERRTYGPRERNPRKNEVIIGRILTPWKFRMKTPRQGRHDSPICRVEIFEPWVTPLRGVVAFERLEILYWPDLCRRNPFLQSPETERGMVSIPSLNRATEPDRHIHCQAH